MIKTYTKYQVYLTIFLPLPNNFISGWTDRTGNVIPSSIHGKTNVYQASKTKDEILYVVLFSVGSHSLNVCTLHV